MTEEYRKSLTFLLDVVHAANGLRQSSKRHDPRDILTKNSPVKQHPYWSLSISLLISFGPWILLLPFFLIQAVFFVILGLLGFGVAGITGGMHYRGSIFLISVDMKAPRITCSVVSILLLRWSHTSRFSLCRSTVDRDALQRWNGK